MPGPRSSVIAFLLSLLLLLAGCAGLKNSATPTSGGTGGGNNPTSGSGVSAPTIVTVSAGSTTGGIGITVPAPAVSPQENIEVLGVTPQGASGSAQNTGDVIHRGAGARIIVFGTGLTPDMTATFSGPKDITISNLRSISSTTGKPGLSMDVSVSSSAALGARTLFLKGTTSDITAFAGGLEVLP